MIDFSRPRRMGLGAFFIIFTKQFLRIIGPLAVVVCIKLLDTSFIGEMSRMKAILLLLGFCVVYSLVMACVSYLPKKFYIKDNNLIFLHGLINREDTCVPLDKVHSLRTEQGIWYRLLDLRGIVFDTLATRQEEIELILTESEWRQLLSVIEKMEDPEQSPVMTTSGSDSATTVRLPDRNLLLAALCQNHLKGMAVLGSVIGVILGNLSDLSEQMTAALAEFLEVHMESLLESPLGLLLFIAVTYILTLLLWLGRVMLRYADMTMKHDGNVLTFTYGLFNRASCRFFRDKVCTIRIKRNFLEKRFGFCTLMLRQALNASAKKEEDNMKLYGTDSSAFFLRWWLNDDYSESPEIISAASGKGVFIRSILTRLALTVAGIILLCHFKLYAWNILPVLYLVVLYFRGIYSMRHSRIELRRSYFIIHAGHFAEIQNFIEYRNVEVVGIRRTPLTKWTRRLSLVLSTSGTTFAVRSLKEEEAVVIYEMLLQKAKRMLSGTLILTHRAEAIEKK